jgi:hypothetical protein
MALAIECRLTCNHIFLAKTPLPYIDDKVWCGRCDTWRRVILVKEWIVKCTVCKYGKHCGASRSIAERLAKQHLNRTGHAVKIKFPGKAAITVSHEEVTESSLLKPLDT